MLYSCNERLREVGSVGALSQAQHAPIVSHSIFSPACKHVARSHTHRVTDFHREGVRMRRTTDHTGTEECALQAYRLFQDFAGEPGAVARCLVIDAYSAASHWDGLSFAWLAGAAKA